MSSASVSVAAGAAGINNNNNNNSTLRHQYSGQYSAISSGNSALLTPLDIQRLEQEQGDTQMMQLIPDQDYLQQRADAMSTVESHIVELGTIFNKLAGLVHEHREMVQRVEDNVEEANASIFQSMNALTDTLENLRTNRALMLRVFSILVVFIIFFIIFFA
jgi:syntaxin 5